VSDKNHLTGKELAALCGVSGAAITQARNKGLLNRGSDNLYDPADQLNVFYIQRNNTNIPRRGPEPSGAKQTAPKSKAKTKKIIDIQNKKKKGFQNGIETHRLGPKIKSEAEILIEAMSMAFSESKIDQEQINLFKKRMIKNAKNIEDGQNIKTNLIPVDKKSITRKTAESLKTIKKFEGDLFPQPGKSTFFITSAQMNAASFLVYAAETFGKIDEVVLSYFRVSAQTVEIFDKLISSGMLMRAYFMLSELSTRDAHPAINDLKYLYSKYPKKIGGGTAQTHTKILLFKIKNNYYCVSGSANMTGTNARIEQYNISNCEDVYIFNRKWIINPGEILNQHDCSFFGNREVFL
jgi:hypothetical protein